YRQIDQSGVLFTALAFATPMILSAVGGFPEVEPAVHVPPGDPAALHDALQRLLADEAARERLRATSRHAARTTYSWERIARAHLALYARARPSARSSGSARGCWPTRRRATRWPS